MPDYFTLSEFRALPQMADSNRYTDARIEDVAGYITGIIERVVGTSFIARTVTKVLDGNGAGSLDLRDAHARTVTALTVDDVVTSYTDLVVSAGFLRYPYSSGGSWTAGYGNVSVTYTTGYSTTPPADIKEAALQGTRARLLSTNSNAEMHDRRTSLTTDQGTVSFVVAGAEQPTGYPEVDAVILGWRDRLNVFGFA